GRAQAAPPLPEAFNHAAPSESNPMLDAEEGAPLRSRGYADSQGDPTAKLQHLPKTDRDDLAATPPPSSAPPQDGTARGVDKVFRGEAYSEEKHLQKAERDAQEGGPAPPSGVAGGISNERADEVDDGEVAGAESERPTGVGQPPGAKRPAPPPLRVGGALKPPRLVRRVEPTYPELARQGRVQGRALLEIVVGADGKVTEVRVVRAEPVLAAAAI